jgi:RimJ/RimL family protein N-acetyltransferase
MLPLFDCYDDVKSSVQPTLAARVVLRAPTSEDRELVAQWFELSDLDPTWGGARQNLAFLATPPVGAEHRVIAIDGQSVGYVRWLPVGAELLEHPMLGRVLAPSATRIDVLVGPRDRRFVGVGSVALRRVREDLAERRGDRGFVGLASIRHLAARRAYEKAGFYYHYFFDDETIGPMVAFVRPGG